MNVVRMEEHPEHIKTAAGWIYNQWGSNLPNGSVKRAEKALGITPGAAGLPISLIALRQGSPVGVARLVKHDMDTRKGLSPWLASVFVPVDYRGRGIGTELCTKGVAEAQKLGFTKLFLFTPDRESFYTRQGWNTIERAIHKDKQVVVMQLEITEQDPAMDAGSLGFQV